MIGLDFVKCIDRDCKKIHHYYSYALDDLNDEKNIKKEKIKLEYIDFEMYKFIF